MTDELEDGRAEATRVLNACAPQCEPLPTVAGIITQIDNYIIGLRERLQLAEDIHDEDRYIGP